MGGWVGGCGCSWCGCECVCSQETGEVLEVCVYLCVRVCVLCSQETGEVLEWERVCTSTLEL